MPLKETFLSLKKAQALLALQNRSQKDAALLAAAAAIDGARAAVLSANAADVERARRGGMKDALVDRLFLDGRRVDAMIEGIKTVADLEDPVGRVKAGWKTPDGLFIEECTVPLGVAAIIYESRPNVTADAASLAYKAGCAILLRGSSAALDSNRAITAAIKQGLKAGGGIAEAVELADSGDHGDVDEILSARGLVDVALPRGGHDLIRRVVENARVPVIETGEGNCHIFVDASADIPEALDIVENAKVQKPGACNAVETVLVHREILSAFMPALAARLAGRVELRCDAASKAAVSGSGEYPAGLRVKDAVEEDWTEEFLDYILAVKTVDSVDQAIEHINRCGTRHSEAILGNDMKNAETFCQKVDAACVYVNASTRFTDGGMFGFGAELGISTQKFHARGPMGLDALTTIKYRISGRGHIRGGQ
ncbi:MAG: glutamate-5-semialdehyde dehydrogenase [Treponema sp.]|jgi:glutamate-5-semialdehyde dehydrogenase|nr:glutamate-5-semialdehyde dehydrogenase [Treponema sp.]